jgi:hypothetical protein
MDKQFIISEIQRTAQNGKAVGQKRFLSETGIKPHEWLGKYWARWGDALLEAGFSQNEWQIAHDEAHIFQSFLGLARKLGRFPTKYDIGLARKSNPDIPGAKMLYRWGTRSDLKAKLLEFCAANEEFADLVVLVGSMSLNEETAVLVKDEGDDESSAAGYVYLVSAQDSYKIGSTRAPYRRVSEIANQSAKGAELLHLISTDDPEGIEQYWHKRFDSKRITGINKQSGEWFALSTEDIKSFKRRKTM